MTTNSKDEVIAITKKDLEMLISLKETPPAPNEALKKAFERTAAKEVFGESANKVLTEGVLLG